MTYLLRQCDVTFLVGLAFASLRLSEDLFAYLRSVYLPKRKINRAIKHNSYFKNIATVMGSLVRHMEKL